MSDPPCISDDELVALVEQRLPAAECERLLGHADGCPDCRELLAGVGRAATATIRPEGQARDDGPDEHLVRGAAIGRYLITDFVGAGAMGEVHAAYDPELDRRVALKFLRPGGGKAEGQRLLREAQTMARLSHPNVVPVHDAGTWGTRFFVAMELVEGETLRGWLAAEPRPWRRVLAAFEQAGRGLAAAHAVGIVHRDFKPDNVLVGKDGRIRVADFGVARAHADEEAVRPAGQPAVDETLTQTGMLLGTPAYMAPEVLAGGPATAASDQLSFCVALHEGLYGTRPFEAGGGRTLAPGAPRVVRPPPRGTRVPAWVRRVVVRGLAARPEERWPSMPALVAALGRNPARPWQVAGLAALVLGGVAVTFVVARASRPAPERPCAGAEARVASIWDAPARARVEAAFAAGGSPGATRTAASFAAAVDAWSERWQRARTEACLDTVVERTQSDEALQRRTACLDRQLDDLRAVSLVAAEPSPKLVDRAAELAGGLPPASRCDLRAVLESRVVAPRDEATGAAAALLGAELARGDALLRAGRFEEALALLQPLADRARALGYPPVEARALYLLGRALDYRWRIEEGVSTLLRAQRLASAVGDDQTALSALVALVFVTGAHQGRPADALTLARDAEILNDRLDDRSLAADLAYYSGIVHHQIRDYVGARALFERALAAYRLAHGPEDYRTGWALDGLGHVAESVEDYTAARGYDEQALAVYVRVNHLPALGNERNNLGNLLVTYLRDYGAAREQLELALVAKGGYAADGPGSGQTLANLALAEYRLGQHARALDDAERGLDLVVKGFGPKHQATAITHETVADVLVELERAPEALEHYRSALAIWREGRPDDGAEAAQDVLTIARVAAEAGLPVDLAAARAALATLRSNVRPGGPRAAYGAALLCHALVGLRRRDEAVADCAAAVAAAEAGLPAGHPDRALALLGAGRALRGAGLLAGAAQRLEEALAVLEPRTGDVILTADVRGALAETLVATGGDRSRARALATSARAAVQGALGPRSRRLDVLDRLLASL